MTTAVVKQCQNITSAVGLVEIISVTLFMVYLTTLSIVSNCVTMDGWVTVNSELERMRKDGRGRRSCNATQFDRCD